MANGLAGICADKHEPAEGGLQRAADGQGGLRWQLSLSVGVILFAPQSGLSLQELMAKADEALYEQKRHRHPS